MRVDLQDGFDKDHVEVYVNGRKRIEAEGVTSRRQLGLALSTEIEVPAGPLEIEIRIPTRKLSKTFSVDTPNLGISIRNGEIEIITSGKRFGYA
jgi:YbbR domain-containing protein